MSRFAIALVAALVAAPEAMACGMYVDQELIALGEALEAIDAEEAEVADAEEAEVADAQVAEVPVPPATDTEAEPDKRRPLRDLLAKVGLRRDGA